MKYNNLTRPSALGMFDPICGHLIYNFVDEKQNQVNNENSVNSKISENKCFFFVEEMKNEEGRGGNQEGKYIFLWRRRKMRKIFGEDLSKNRQGY